MKVDKSYKMWPELLKSSVFNDLSASLRGPRKRCDSLTYLYGHSMA